jgi:S-adenosylmethionine:diacylglycerol 3-amino-3-carboxypropyl transferase
MEMTPATAATSWKHGRFDARNRPGKLLFGRMHEDAAIELRALPRGSRVFCIASAGCTAMRLAQQHEVVAADINPVQLAYVERRLAGGPVRHGVAERILALIRNLGPLAGWSRSRVRSFLEFDDATEQLSYWRRYLDTRRFRAALVFLFSRRLLRSIYSASFLDCLPPDFGTVMRRRMERGFATHPNRSNPFAQALYRGTMPRETDYPAPSQVRLVCADAADFLEGQPAGSFGGFALSNIFDGANDAYERRLNTLVKRTAAAGAMVVRRSFREPSFMAPTNHAEEDRAMFWGIVDVRPAKDL